MTMLSVLVMLFAVTTDAEPPVARIGNTTISAAQVGCTTSVSGDGKPLVDCPASSRMRFERQSRSLLIARAAERERIAVTEAELEAVLPPMDLDRVAEVWTALLLARAAIDRGEQRAEVEECYLKPHQLSLEDLRALETLTPEAVVRSIDVDPRPSVETSLRQQFRDQLRVAKLRERLMERSRSEDRNAVDLERELWLGILKSDVKLIDPRFVLPDMQGTLIAPGP